MKKIRQISNLQFNEDFSAEKEFDYTVERLKEYVVPLPEEETINFTLEQLRQYVPKKKRYDILHLEKFINLIQLAALDIEFMSKGYWVISCIMFILGYIILSPSKYSPYILTMMLSPLPLVLGIIEIFKGREQKVYEIELSCKITPQEIMISKLIVISVYNILLNSFGTLVLTSIEAEIVVWRIILMWFTPMTVIGGISLWLANRMRGGYVTTFVLGLWMSTMLIVCTQPQIADRLVKVNIMFYVVSLIIGIMLITLQVKKIMDRYYFERSANYEIEH